MVRIARVFALIALLLGLAAQPASVSGLSSASDSDDAKRFREAHGLRSDADTLATAAADRTAYPELEFGVPLSKAEAAEVRRRTGVVDSAGPAVAFAARQDGYAGEYIDQLDGGKPVFLFTKTPGQHEEAIATLLPAGTRFAVAQAEFSLATLLETQRRVDAAKPELLARGIRVRLTGIDPRSNRLVVGVEDLKTGDDARLVDAFGPALLIRDEGRGEADACSYRNCWPLKGGIEIYSAVGGGQCTSGYIGRRSGTSTYAVITAGHCLQRWGGSGVVWKHGTSTVHNFGVSQKNTWSEGADADAGIIHIDSADVPQFRNVILTTVTSPRSMTGAKAATDQLVGQTVCRTGRTSGNDCGILRLKNVTRDSCVLFPSGEICRTLNFQMEVDFDSTGGDSGGPMYNGSNLLGIHIDSERDTDPLPHYGWYSTVGEVRTTYSEFHGVLYDICISSGCASVWP